MKHKNKNRDSTASPYGLPYPEKVLSDTPSFHRQIMDNMLEGCQIIGFDWKFVYVNDAAARDGRIDKERLLDHTLMECYPGIENSMLFTNLKECMEKRIARRFDNEFVFPDASHGWFNLSVQPIPEGLFILSLKVTDTKKAQEQLHVSEQKLKLFVEHAPAAIAMFDKEMRYLAVSRRFLSDYGIAGQTIIGLSHYEVFPEISDHIREIHHRCLAGISKKSEQDPFVRADGSLDWVKWEVKPWYESGKNVGGIVLFSEVITEKKLREEEIRRINENLELLITERTAELSDLYNNAPCGYHSIDANGVFQRMNDTALRWLGYERTEVIGKMKTVDILSENSRAIYQHLFPTFKKNGFIKDVEVDFVRKDGSMFSVLLNATAILDKEGNFLHSRSTTIDNTDRKRFEENLKAALSNLESANKELEAFSYSVSHDLRAPLRAISGFTNILSEDYKKLFDEEARRICQVIQSNAQKMGRLIDDLLAFSRFGRSELNISNHSMENMVKAIIDELVTPETAGRIRISIDTLPDAVVDISLFRQVWLNLISNAIKYTSRRETAEIKISAAKHDHEVFFSITDNGIGFDMKYAHHLFGVFQRLHSDADFEGTGVGLAIVKRIVNRHGGRVWAQGYPDKGAVFGFVLPC